MSSRIIISDPHGCLETLKSLVAKLPEGIPITFAGDFIDRGPDSAGVVDYIMNSGHDAIIGNHEVMMLNDIEFRVKEDGTEQVFAPQDGDWRYNGGDAALRSYLKEDGTYDIPRLKKHVEWFKTLPYFIEYPELKDDKGQHLLVSHSTPAHVWGEYSPENPIFKQSILWERDPMPPKIDGRFSVYGHTPQKFKPTIKDHFAAIDGGCYYKYSDYNRLTAFQFPEMIVYEVRNCEQEPENETK
jgi:serine/threonine protein phosphatase 1